jgi:hypothetical protein
VRVTVLSLPDLSPPPPAKAKDIGNIILAAKKVSSDFFIIISSKKFFHSINAAISACFFNFVRPGNPEKCMVEKVSFVDYNMPWNLQIPQSFFARIGLE